MAHPDLMIGKSGGFSTASHSGKVRSAGAVVAASRQSTDEQFANKITRRCVQWRLPNAPQ